MVEGKPEWGNLIPENEQIAGCWFVVFVNHRKELQDRILVLTDKAYYRVKPGGDLFSIFSHFKRYELNTVSNVRLQKVNITVDMDPSTLPEVACCALDTGVLKRICIYTGIVSMQQEVTEYAITVCSLDETKTYVKPRLRRNDVPSKAVLGDMVLKFVNALFSCEDSAVIDHLLSGPPSLHPRASHASVRFRESMFPARAASMMPSDISMNSMGLDKRKSERLLEIMDVDDDRLEILDTSELVSLGILFQIFLRTPNFLESRWSLVYDVNKNGGSINNFYYTLQKGNYKEVVILLKDEQQQVFGAYTSHGWRPANAPYGSGLNFLFKVPFLPEDTPLTSVRVKFYPWRKDMGNHSYQMSTQTYLAMGSGGSGYGLWLDDELWNGVSDSCDTYGNEPLAATNVFKVIGMEVWCKKD